ncbi:hypothetical protein PG987_015896 [Apiospora arundinis]
MDSDKPHTVISFIGGRKYQVPAKYSPDSDSSNLDQFTCFSKLPPEIRTMIWQLAVPERITQVSRTAHHIDYDGDKSRREIPRTFFDYCPCTTKDACHHPGLPPVAQTCREAREAYKRLTDGSAWYEPYSFWGVAQPSNMWFNPSTDGSAWYVPNSFWGGAQPSKMWFNPSTDVLCLDQWGHKFDEFNMNILHQHAPRLVLVPFAEKVRVMAFSLGRRENIFYGGMYDEIVNIMADKNRCPRLETFMVYDETIYLHPREEVTLPANTVSAENPMALVNIRDTERIRHFKKAYESYSLPSHLDRKRVELLASLLTKDGLEYYTDYMNHEIVNMWAEELRRDEVTPRATDFMYILYDENLNRFRFIPFDRRHPWVRDVVMPRMPPFQIVVAFKLCQASDHQVHKPQSAI